MTTEQKGFIITVSMNINNMPANWGAMTWNKFPVRMEITDNTIITIVNGTKYNDELPMKSGRRNRKEMANIVCNHIAETWGGTMEEVSAHAAAALAEFNAVFGINA